MAGIYEITLSNRMNRGAMLHFDASRSIAHSSLHPDDQFLCELVFIRGALSRASSGDYCC